MAIHAELFCDANYTPIRGPNPLWTGPTDKIHPQWIQDAPCHDVLISYGFREMPMIYDGSLNRAPTWVMDDGTFLDMNHIDWSKEGPFNAPPLEFAVRKSVVHFNGVNGTHPIFPSKQLNPPFLFDLENPYFSVSLDAPDADRQKIVDAMTETVIWAKTSAPSSNVGWYGVPPMWNGDSLVNEPRLRTYQKYHTMMRDFANEIDFAAPGFYNWDYPAAFPDRWFDSVDSTTRILDQYFSFLPRVAVLCPTYQIYNPVYWKQVAHLNDVPVPLALWRKQIQYLVDRDYDLYLWTGYTVPTTGVLQNLAACRKFLNNG